MLIDLKKKMKRIKGRKKKRKNREKRMRNGTEKKYII